MFNAKRIIFLIGLLSLVTLTGALLAGPAFASKPASAHKATMCHFQRYQAAVDATATTPAKPEELAMWMVKNKIDSKSVQSHLNNHANGDFTDTLISAPVGMFEGYPLTTEEECLARPVVA